MDFNEQHRQLPANSSSNKLFSLQTAFSSAPSMDLLPENHLVNVGLNVFQRGFADWKGKIVEQKQFLLPIKTYFDIDEAYVIKKLSLLLFPFRSRNWSLQYHADEPVPPRVDTNAPDYYIPLMSAITYVLLAGVALGTQSRFTPEQLGSHASSLFFWNVIENCFLSLIFFVLNVRSTLSTSDLIAYCGYKYVGMIAALIIYLITSSLFIYRCALLYISIAIMYFLMQCLRLKFLPDTGSGQQNGNHRIYLLLLILVLQPVFIWYLTRHLIVN